MAQRKSSHGEGEYCFPGGHLELGESFADCAQREVREETGMEIENIEFLYLANLRNFHGKHHVQISLKADWKSGEPINLEKDKSGEWRWYSVNDLPSPIFKPCKMAFKVLRTKQYYFDN